MRWDTVMKVISNGTVKYGSADEFNDPLELSGDLLDFSFTRDQMKNFLEKNYPGSAQKREQLLEEHMKDPEIMRIVQSNAIEQYRKKIAIWCLSQRFDAPLMWIHYAQEHTGVCIGFRFFSPMIFTGCPAI